MTPLRPCAEHAILRLDAAEKPRRESEEINGC